MNLPSDYNRQVYTAVLGKVIGVYLGRPFEGWNKKDIEAKWGVIDHYVHEDRGVPLVVADDDITGTFTFIRALADSGLLADTPPDFFGKTWRNYLLEGQTILWWGGMSHSTEHTAWIRLKQGYESPATGSMALNGKEVSEQIGAQIFIDAFGMVCPGDPDTAARLAKMAAGVSHDGEAVIAAQVVAMLVSLAFVEKDMDRLLDAVLARIPSDSLIAHVHRDVRAWAREDGDWRRTYERIDEKYGYHLYGGNCHVIPNHALMVMAWAYAKGDFFQALSIVATAGWDTDCNAANVGTVSALVAGLDHLCDRYDFRRFADRVLLPTAEGTAGVSDCLRIARFISALGHAIAEGGATPLAPASASFRFDEPGALHGFATEEGSVGAGTAPVGAGTPCTNPDGRAMHISFRTGLRVSTPITPTDGASGSYALCATPLLARGMTVTVRGTVGTVTPGATLALATRHCYSDALCLSSPLALVANAPFELAWTLSNVPSVAVQDFLLVFGGEGELSVSSVDFSDAVDLDFSREFGTEGWRRDGLAGWITNATTLRGSFSNDAEPQRRFGSNGDPVVLVTGNRHWTDTTLSCHFNVHAADRAGVLLRYQGMQRYLLLEFTKTTARIVRQHYGETVLAETPFVLEENRMVDLEARVTGDTVTLCVDGRELLRATDDTFANGGAGFFVQCGLAGASRVRIRSHIL